MKQGFIGLSQQEGPHGLWLADMSKTEKADTILDLFGTHTLPTPFLAVTPFEIVKMELLKGNPDARIGCVVCGEDDTDFCKNLR